MGVEWGKPVRWGWCWEGHELVGVSLGREVLWGASVCQHVEEGNTGALQGTGGWAKGEL